MTSHSSGNYVTFDKTTIDAPARLEAGTCDAAASSESETRRGRQQTGCMLDATRVGGFTLTMRTLIFTFVCVVLVAQSRAAVPVKTSDTGFRPINGPLKPSRNPNFFVDASGTSDRKSTRLNSSHVEISYAVFCLKKKKTPKKSNTI